MSERPIPMSAPMVRAILAGTKTQTRRVVKPVGADDGFVLQNYGTGWWPYRSDDGESPMKDGNEIPHACPYGQPGDRLWVREAWHTVAEADATKPSDLDAAYRFWFEADAPHQPGYGKLRPGMFMPRWASRITLEVTGVRVERLQDISEADAVAEGCQPLPLQQAEPGAWWTADVSAGAALHARTAAGAYRLLWERINGAGSWDANPWVWAVEFRRIESEAAQERRAA